MVVTHYPGTSQNLLGRPQVISVCYSRLEDVTWLPDSLNTDLDILNIVATQRLHKTYCGGRMPPKFAVADCENI